MQNENALLNHLRQPSEKEQMKWQKQTNENTKTQSSKHKPQKLQKLRDFLYTVTLNFLLNGKGSSDNFI